MDYLGFMFFSTCENISFYLFILVLFRFPIQSNLLKFAVFAVFQSFVSNSLQIESLQAVSALIQAIMVIFFVAIFLRVHFLNAAIVVVTGYIINFIVQWLVLIVTIHFSGSEVIVPGSSKGFIVQLASSCVMLLITLIIYLQRGGFGFIDHESRAKRSKVFTKQNRPLIIFISLSIVLTFLTNLLYNFYRPPYLIIAIVLFIVLIGLLYICMKKDELSHG